MPSARPSLTSVHLGLFISMGDRSCFLRFSCCSRCSRLSSPSWLIFHHYSSRGKGCKTVLSWIPLRWPLPMTVGEEPKITG